MNLKERLALRKVATYRINWIERKYLKRRMDACSAILTRVETKVDNLSGILNISTEVESLYRSPLLWYTFNNIIVSLRTAWDEIHPYPFKENDIVYPGKYVDEMDDLSSAILGWAQTAVVEFKLDAVIENSAHLIFDKQDTVPPLYVSHFEIMLKYLKRYVKDHSFDPLCLFTPTSLKAAKKLIEYAESSESYETSVPLKTESEDSL